jgi:hypothetical protein
MNTLRELYNLHPDESGLNTGLINWYNSVIDKTYNELDVADVVKMYRQGIILDVAVERAIDLILLNPYDGEYNDGGLMELIVTMELNQINCEKTEQLKLLIKKILGEYKMFDWCGDEDMNNFKSSIDLLGTKI